MKKHKLSVVFMMIIISTILCSCNSSKTESKKEEIKKTWLEVPSLKETYGKYFDTIGVAINEQELGLSAALDGIDYHFSSITMENEFKPQFMFNWKSPNNNGKYTASNGLTISVPTNVPDFSRMDRILKMCKVLGYKMRGHVLVWHSQTEKSFFREKYNPNGPLVDKNTMDARQEWYIQTVLEHIKNWEDQNNNGERIVWVWDVVNEAAADGGSSYLRTSDSDWYKIYKSDEYIVNAFRYANKYAPKDVLLAYNDYNCYMGNKTNGILKIIQAIQDAEDDAELPSRIDVMGMQSHVGLSYPNTSLYASAINRFIKTGLDIHITELDVATGSSSAESVAFRYKELFNTYMRYRKTDTSNGITSITLWGLNDERSWIKTKDGKSQSPLLFTKELNTYYAKPCFNSVIEAAQIGNLK